MKSDCCGAGLYVGSALRCGECGKESFSTDGHYISELILQLCKVHEFIAASNLTDHIPDAAKKVAEHIVDANKKVEWPTELKIEKEIDRLVDKYGKRGFGGFDSRMDIEDVARAMHDWLRERMEEG